MQAKQQVTREGAKWLVCIPFCALTTNTTSAEDTPVARGGYSSPSSLHGNVERLGGDGIDDCGVAANIIRLEEAKNVR